MSGQRAVGQKLINFPASDDFIAELNRASAEAGYTSRSEFIRDAIIEKAAAHGFQINPRLAVAPPRAGRQQRPSSFAVVDSIDDGKTGQKREFSGSANGADRTGSGADVQDGSDYQAPVARIPPQRISTQEPLQGVSPGVRERVQAAGPAGVAMAKARAKERAEIAKKQAASGRKPTRARGTGF